MTEKSERRRIERAVDNMAQSHLANHIQNRENLQCVEQERLLIETATLIYRTMKEKGITRSALAEKLGVTKGRISQYLGGERNLRLRTLADIFTAMDSQLVIASSDLPVESQEWQEISELPPWVHFARKSPWQRECAEPGNLIDALAG